MERYSVMDIGSNSIRLLRCAVEDGRIITAEKDLIMTRLGQGVNETDRLSDEAMAHSYEALKVFAKESAAYEGKFMGAFATSAVRDSENRQSFVDEVYLRTGIRVEVIDGDREAKLGFLGVLAGVVLSGDDHMAMIIDIGGGSTEIIVGDTEGIRYGKSFDMGAVRMTEMFLRSDPPKRQEVESLKSFVRKMAIEIEAVCKDYRPSVAVGIGGTITTVGAVALGMKTYDRTKIHQYQLENKVIEEHFQAFMKPLKDRLEIPGLQPKRADIITAGTAILQEVMGIADFKTIQVSDYDNLEGVLAEAGILKIGLDRERSCF